MLRIKQAVIVEGKYDKIKLSSIIDALIIEVNGFQVFKNKETIELIKFLANTCGIIIMTDSDSAGMLIRNRISQIAIKGEVYQAYIPEVWGNEKWNNKPSAEGLLGVEGLDKSHIISALKRCGLSSSETDKATYQFTTLDLYNLGLTGKEYSKEFRNKVLEHLNLPKNISKNNLLKILGYIVTPEQLNEICNEIGGFLNGGQS